MVVGTKCGPVEGLEFLKGDPVAVPCPGKVTVIELWAKWCGPCRQIFPHLSDIYKQRKNKGLVVVGVSIEDDPTLKTFVQQEGERMAYTVAVDKKGAAAGLMTRAGVTGIPHAFVVDSTGMITHSGHPGQPVFIQKIDEALQSVVVEQPARKALPLITASKDELMQMGVKVLKDILDARGINFSDLKEKTELVDRILQLCRTATYYERQ